jgi:3-deoxy-7-phosphoheptulonate synthase
MNHVHRPASVPCTHDTTRIDDAHQGRAPLDHPCTAAGVAARGRRPGAGGGSRAAISRVLHGQDDRLVVVVGPCSIHDHDRGHGLRAPLKAQAEALQDDLLVVMRVYFEKPAHHRGLEGYINDPHLDGSSAINEG